jgi:hypothetical protein
MRYAKRRAIVTHYSNLQLDKDIKHLESQLQPLPQPVRLELNRDAGAILTAITIGCFIMAAAVLLHLFVDLNTGGLVQ